MFRDLCSGAAEPEEPDSEWAAAVSNATDSQGCMAGDEEAARILQDIDKGNFAVMTELAAGVAAVDAVAAAEAEEKRAAAQSAAAKAENKAAAAAAAAAKTTARKAQKIAKKQRHAATLTPVEEEGVEEEEKIGGASRPSETSCVRVSTSTTKPSSKTSFLQSGATTR